MPLTAKSVISKISCSMTRTGAFAISSSTPAIGGLGKRVLISPFAVKTIDWFDRHVELNVSRELVKASPPWDPLLAFNDEYAKRLHKHYGWPGSRA